MRDSRFETLLRVLPGGCSTAAKSPLRHAPGHTPHFAVAGSGGRFEDDHGRVWLDFDMALSSVVLGYAHPEVDRAVVAQVRRGVSFSVPGVVEGSLAERVIDRFPGIEALRFCKDGSDATSGAVRLARKVTGRSKVVFGAYHGWHDWSAAGYYGSDGVGPRELGIPEAVASSSIWRGGADEGEDPFRSIGFDDVAAVVVCPEDLEPAVLSALAGRCRDRGTVLVHDEIRSGLRFGPRGVHGAFGAEPDLVCLGKSIANGYPLAVLGGRAELIQELETIRFSTTGSSELVSMAAALAVDDVVRSVPAWPPWREATAEMMGRLRARIEGGRADGSLKLSGFPGSFRVHSPGKVARLDPFRKWLVTRLSRDRIFSGGFIVPCLAHTQEELDRVERAVLDAIDTWGDRECPESAV